MAPTDPHEGGSLTSMAESGTTMPNDAGKQNLIPSVPNPAQASAPTSGGLGATSPATAADNATDMPRGPADTGASADLVTGTGDALPASVTSKNLHMTADNDLAKGSARADKHARSNRSEFETLAGEGAGVEPAPGEEGDAQDAVRDRKGL
ncbi:MAG: hypothetical protein M1819_000057 [Sarea resinae]|nr:MAG: hypothetical protein M1819_000057 [Sarea resinae]